jgi:hypothetical protein
MSHFALVEHSIVVNVIVAEQDFINTLPNKNDWVQTSYNTRGNVHYGEDGRPDGGTPLRGNYAGIGALYDKDNDVFYDPKPDKDHVLDTNTWTWIIKPIPTVIF